jgi:FtsP/CotA-like multicopper oxidase with cupredoxin domain
MATPTIHRHLVAGGAEDRQFTKFVDPPSEPDRTLDRVAPDVRIARRLAENFDLPLPFRLPNGDRKLRMWVIADPGRAVTFPSPLVRVRAGQTVHATVSTSKGEHTIHWHGIEPTPMNDGVGKHSFEIKGTYTYQWTPRQPGFFYSHGPVNTPLHFEMGLLGGLIVDPARGPGWVAARNAPDHLVRYDTEAIWITSAHDPRWHNLPTDHGQHPLDAQGRDVIEPNDPAGFTTTGILNDWRPSVFTISGAVARDGATPITDPRAAVSARVGQTVLVRLLNASYAVAEYRLGADAQVIAQDGHPFGVPPLHAYSAPYTISANRPFRLTAAMRYDLLVRPTSAGTIPFSVDYLDWRGYGSRGRARTTITVGA